MNQGRTSEHNLKLSSVIRDTKNIYKRGGHIYGAVLKATEDGPPKQFYEVVAALDAVAQERYDSTVKDLHDQGKTDEIAMVLFGAERVALGIEQSIDAGGLVL